MGPSHPIENRVGNFDGLRITFYSALGTRHSAQKKAAPGYPRARLLCLQKGLLVLQEGEYNLRSKVSLRYGSYTGLLQDLQFHDFDLLFCEVGV